MQQKSTARQILDGPIRDPGHQHLALVILSMTGSDGWATMTRSALAEISGLTPKTIGKRVKSMVDSGWIEEREKPAPGFSITSLAVGGNQNIFPVEGKYFPVEGKILPVGHQGDDRKNLPVEGKNLPVEGKIFPVVNPSAYLPKRSKDLKEEDKEKDPPSSSPGAGLVLVDTNPTPEPPLLDQPAAQPPAIVEQGEGRPDELLPAKPKRKRQPTAGRATCIPEGWEVPADTLDHLEQTWGIPRAYSEALVWEFRTYWTDSRGRKKSWPSTFINHAKGQWKREQEHAERAKVNQKYRDRSGKPISEADYLARENARRVIADMESGVLDGFDLDTPV